MCNCNKPPRTGTRKAAKRTTQTSAAERVRQRQAEKAARAESSAVDRATRA